MKEATGETSMTMITLVAIGVIAAILAFMWPTISNWIQSTFANNVDQGGFDPKNQTTGYIEVVTENENV